MQNADDIVSFIAAQPEMSRLLRAVETRALPDCWIGAGFVRNAVWDALHGRAPDCAALNDVDVVFFASSDVGPARDIAVEAELKLSCPGIAWSVKNQARMHTRNNESPYNDTRSAIARWPETATAVAVRSSNGRVELLAPHGVGDLIRLIVRPTPAFAARPEQFAARLCAKGWLTRWPLLRIAGV
jgi:uncharacterized protein